MLSIPVERWWCVPQSIFFAWIFIIAHFGTTSAAGPILTAGIARYTDKINKLKPTTTGTALGTNAVTLSDLTVSVDSADESFVFPVNESYAIVIAEGKATITAPTTYGALRGMEVFLQMSEVTSVSRWVSYIHQLWYMGEVHFKIGSFIVSIFQFFICSIESLFE